MAADCGVSETITYNNLNEVKYKQEATTVDWCHVVRQFDSRLFQLLLCVSLSDRLNSDSMTEHIIIDDDATSYRFSRSLPRPLVVTSDPVQPSKSSSLEQYAVYHSNSYNIKVKTFANKTIQKYNTH